MRVCVSYFHNVSQVRLAIEKFMIRVVGIARISQYLFNRHGRTSPFTPDLGFLLSLIFFDTSCGRYTGKGDGNAVGICHLSRGANSSVISEN